MIGNEVGIDLAFTEQGIFQHLTEKGNGGFDAADNILAESAIHDAQGFFPIMGIRDKQRPGES